MMQWLPHWLWLAWYLHPAACVLQIFNSMVFEKCVMRTSHRLIVILCYEGKPPFDCNLGSNDSWMDGQSISFLQQNMWVESLCSIWAISGRGACIMSRFFRVTNWCQYTVSHMYIYIAPCSDEATRSFLHLDHQLNFKISISQQLHADTALQMVVTNGCKTH